MGVVTACSTPLTVRDMIGNWSCQTRQLRPWLWGYSFWISGVSLSACNGILGGGERRRRGDDATWQVLFIIGTAFFLVGSISNLVPGVYSGDMLSAAVPSVLQGGTPSIRPTDWLTARMRCTPAVWA